MQPTHAEVARTLTAGHLPASAHIACRQGPLPVRHVTDAHGRVLLLSTPSLLGEEDDIAVALEIPDVPPIAGAPSLGHAWLAGWATTLSGDEARTAALDYADVDASGDLLDVGNTLVLRRMEAAEVRLERGGKTFDIDPEEYAEATPDPLRVIEFDLLADLADHHVPEMTAYVRRRLGPAAAGATPEVVRLDRYGFVVRIGGRLARLAFPRAVEDRHDLAHLLHPVLCHRCAG
jgi:hypothetical protein